MHNGKRLNILYQGAKLAFFFGLRKDLGKNTLKYS